MAEREVKLLCGEGTVDVSLPESVPTLEMKRLNVPPDPEGAVYEALADPIMSQPLKEMARGRKNACCDFGFYPSCAKQNHPAPVAQNPRTKRHEQRKNYHPDSHGHAQAKSGRRTGVPCGPGN